jgi:hypothetical protein
VLQAFVPSVEELLVEGRRVVPRLDQLDLQVPGIGQRDAHSDRGVLAAMAKPVCLDVFNVKPGANAHDVDPMIHGGVYITHHVAILPNGPKDTAQKIAPILCCFFMAVRLDC